MSLHVNVTTRHLELRYISIFTNLPQTLEDLLKAKYNAILNVLSLNLYIYIHI